MGFMKSYKHLDSLCRDMNGIGVTGYLEDMEQETRGELYVAGWKADYLQLKHYRHIRNQIAHEADADEESMCSSQDAAWIDGFYQRIMGQTDPLALCYQKTRLRTAPKPARTADIPSGSGIPLPSECRQEADKPARPVWALLAIIAAAILIFFLLRLT